MRGRWLLIFSLLALRGFAVEPRSDRATTDERVPTAITQAPSDRDSGSSSGAPVDLDDDDDDDGDLILPATHDAAPLLVVERRPRELVTVRAAQHEPAGLFRPPRLALS